MLDKLSHTNCTTVEANGVCSNPYLGSWDEHCIISTVFCVEFMKYAGNPKQTCWEMRVFKCGEGKCNPKWHITGGEREVLWATSLIPVKCWCSGLLIKTSWHLWLHVIKKWKIFIPSIYPLICDKGKNQSAFIQAHHLLEGKVFSSVPMNIAFHCLCSICGHLHCLSVSASEANIIICH